VSNPVADLKKILESPEAAEVADLLLTLYGQFSGAPVAGTPGAIASTAGALGLAKVLDAGIQRICQEIRAAGELIAACNIGSTPTFVRSDDAVSQMLRVKDSLDVR